LASARNIVCRSIESLVVILQDLRPKLALPEVDDTLAGHAILRAPWSGGIATFESLFDGLLQPSWDFRVDRLVHIVLRKGITAYLVDSLEMSLYA
jgi:hypothetical protein